MHDQDEGAVQEMSQVKEVIAEVEQLRGMLGDIDASTEIAAMEVQAWVSPLGEATPFWSATHGCVSTTRFCRVNGGYRGHRGLE